MCWVTSASKSSGSNIWKQQREDEENRDKEIDNRGEPQEDPRIQTGMDQAFTMAFTAVAARPRMSCDRSVGGAPKGVWSVGAVRTQSRETMALHPSSASLLTYRTAGAFRGADRWLREEEPPMEGKSNQCSL